MSSSQVTKVLFGYLVDTWYMRKNQGEEGLYIYPLYKIYIIDKYRYTTVYPSMTLESWMNPIFLRQVAATKFSSIGNWKLWYFGCCEWTYGLPLLYCSTSIPNTMVKLWKLHGVFNWPCRTSDCSLVQQSGTTCFPFFPREVLSPNQFWIYSARVFVS